MPTIGSETYRSTERPDATKETKLSESAIPPSSVRGEDWPAGPVATGLNPSIMPVPGPDSEVSVTGTGFTPESVIVWNHGDEQTEYVSDTELKTIVKPSTVEAELPFTFSVAVRTGTLLSDPLPFTFIAGEPVG